MSLPVEVQSQDLRIGALHFLGRGSAENLEPTNNEAVVDCSDVIACSSVKKEPTMMVENASKILSTQVCNDPPAPVFHHREVGSGSVHQP